MRIMNKIFSFNPVIKLAFISIKVKLDFHLHVSPTMSDVSVGSSLFIEITIFVVVAPSLLEKVHTLESLS